MENSKSILYLEIGLFCFILLLLISILISPAGLGANSGISYYGVGNTILPYSIAFILESILVWRAASIMKINTKTDRYISLILKLFSILFVCIMITPHTIFGELHKFFGSTLFSIQLVMGVLLTWYFCRDWLNILLLSITFVSGLMSLIYLYTPTGYMIQSQITFQICVWVIFIRSFLKINMTSRQ